MAQAIPATTSDIEILRAYEPVVRYTQGEKFFPMDVEPYVRASSLWLHFGEGLDEEVVPEGELTLDDLVEPREAPFGSLFYLRFVDPLDLQGSAAALVGSRRLEKRERSGFKAGLGRLARGGLLPRLGDGLFSLSLLLRGTVPGATAAAAVLKYAELRKRDGRLVYHGRVVRQAGWTVCQYWFFFAYNPWRSGFHGVNDHESDWEMVSVYLFEQDGRLQPEWAAYASHDFHGADLRRRWDDRVDLELEGGHPVVYAGAGSHASYFRRGEYQAEVPIPAPTRVKRFVAFAVRVWRTNLGQGDGQHPLRIPFIDFARGDGIAIGPEQPHEWTRRVIDETTPWVSRYRGLWGLYARDPISGENAPAGPMYERDGSPRGPWFDPLGFAGLTQVTPPPGQLAGLEDEGARLDAQSGELDRQIAEQTDTIRELGALLESTRGNPHLAGEARRLEEQATEQAAEITRLRRERSEAEALRESLQRSIERRRHGRSDDARAHIRRAATPVSPATMRFNAAAELWASLSLSLLLIGLAVLLVASPSNVWAEIVALIIAFVLSDALLRGTFVRVVNRVAVILALIAVVVLFVQHARLVLVALLTALALFLLYQRFQELHS